MLGRSNARLLVAALAIGAIAGLALPRIANVAAPGEAAEHPSLADEPTGRLRGLTYSAIADERPDARAYSRAKRAALTHPAIVRRGPAEAVLVRPYGPFRVNEVPAADPCRSRACLNVTVVITGTPDAFEVYVDPARDRVLRVRPSDGPPPLSAAERRRAHALAEADPEVVALVGDEPHRHPAVLTKPLWPPGICDTHRCGTVLFTFDDQHATGIGRTIQVLVDMTDLAVLDVRPITCDAQACRSGWDR